MSILKTHFHVFRAEKLVFKSWNISDNSAELVEVRVGLTTVTTTNEQHCKCIRAAKETSTNHKSKLRVKPIKIRAKHDVTRSLSEFWTIQIFSLHCDQINRHQHHRESGRLALY